MLDASAGGAYATLVRRQVFAGNDSGSHQQDAVNPAAKSLAAIAQERGLKLGPDMTRQVCVWLSKPQLQKLCILRTQSVGLPNILSSLLDTTNVPCSSRCVCFWAAIWVIASYMKRCNAARAAKCKTCKSNTQLLQAWKPSRTAHHMTLQSHS